MIEMKVSFDTDLARAMEDTKVWAALALTGEQKANIHDPREMEGRGKEAEPYAHKRWLVSDDPDEHLEQLRPYLDTASPTSCSTSRARTRRRRSRATAS